MNLSGRLRRPWPDISALVLPTHAVIGLAIAVMGSFLPGLIGIVAGLFAASLAIAYAALGLAFLHARTAHLKSRAIVLTGVYASILLFGWPLLAITLLGIADALLNLRGRTARKPNRPSGPIA